MDLQGAVQHALGATGPLAQQLDGFKPRSGQTLMAVEVARAMDEGGVLAVEAGTGIGKTFAYLIPALLSGKRVVLSTATKNLQDQLFDRDIPRLTAALGVVVRVALLKGRSSYLCLHRLGLARHHEDALTVASLRDLAQVESWSVSTRSGDMAELTHLDERSPIVPLVTSTRENCWGAQCPQVQQCHVNLARREAMGADLLVINHHLFFADWQVRESGVAELLPGVDCVVLDEAHHLNGIGVQFLGRQFSTTQLDALCRDLIPLGPQLAQAGDDWRRLVEQLQCAGAALHTVSRAVGEPGARLPWVATNPEGIDAAQWDAAVMQIHTALQQVDMRLRGLQDGLPALNVLSARTSALTAELDHFSHPVQEGQVRWLEVAQQVTLVQSPLDVAQAMRTRVLPGPGEPDTDARKKTWIFTSATLGHDASMAWFLESCGLQGARCLQVPSPFDYGAQSALYIPADMPPPHDAQHSAAVAALAAQAGEILGGRILVLTTTLRAMRAIGESLRAHFAALTGVEVLIQGESPKLELVARLARANAVGQSGCIVVASASFWEGIDVAGDALQLVIIDKLPFSPPDDPLVEARAKQMTAAGKNAFMHFHVPEAARTLKQGAGRLIRTETDRGILVVCDVRLSQKGYGRKIRAALPAMQYLDTPAQFRLALEALTRPSTTDRCSASRP